MKLTAFCITFFSVISCSLTQPTQLQGEYRHTKQNEFHSIFTFHDDNFTLIEVGDLGRFFGKGKYRVNSNTLVLTFDTLNLDRSQTQAYAIIEPKIDSLNVDRITGNEFGIRYVLNNGKHYVERYIKR